MLHAAEASQERLQVRDDQRHDARDGGGGRVQGTGVPGPVRGDDDEGEVPAGDVQRRAPHLQDEPGCWVLMLK